MVKIYNDPTKHCHKVPPLSQERLYNLSSSLGTALSQDVSSLIKNPYPLKAGYTHIYTITYLVMSSLFLTDVRTIDRTWEDVLSVEEQSGDKERCLQPLSSALCFK